MYIDVGEETLFFEKAGAGDNTFILIHNACGNHHFFTHQMDALSKHGTVYAIDMPGHGHSLAKKNTYSTLDFANLIAGIIKKLNLKNIYLLGLNNGANVSLELSLNKNVDIKQLLLIAPLLFLDENFVAEVNHLITHFQSPNMDTLIENLGKNFIKTDEKNKKIAREAFQTVSKPVAISICRDLLEWSKNSKAKLLHLFVSTLIILTDDHCPYAPLVGLNPFISVAKVVGSKCWATLEVPEQINAMIERTIELTPG